MNRKQSIVITIGITIIAAMLLFPPWKSYRAKGSGGNHAGYGFLLDPSLRLRLDIWEAAIRWDTSADIFIDSTVLFIQCLLVATITGGVTFLFQNPSHPSQPQKPKSDKPYPSLTEIHEQEDEELEQAEKEIRKLKSTRIAYRVSVVVLTVLLLYFTLRHM